MSALCGQIKAAMESLNNFRPTLDHLGSARDVVEMIMELGKPLSGVKYCWLEIVEFYGIKSVRFYEVGRFLFLTLIVWLIDFPAFRGSGRISCRMGILAGQLNRLKQVPKSNELGVTINEFLGMMEEVVDLFRGGSKIGRVRINSSEMDSSLNLSSRSNTSSLLLKGNWIMGQSRCFCG